MACWSLLPLALSTVNRGGLVGSQAPTQGPACVIPIDLPGSLGGRIMEKERMGLSRDCWLPSEKQLRKACKIAGLPHLHSSIKRTSTLFPWLRSLLVKAVLWCHCFCEGQVPLSFT